MAVASTFGSGLFLVIMLAVSSELGPVISPSAVGGEASGEPAIAVNCFLWVPFNAEVARLRCVILSQFDHASGQPRIALRACSAWVLIDSVLI